MNRGDLNRILNKLTAAANPFPDDFVRPDSAKKITDDPCGKLEKYNYVGKIVRDIKKRMVDGGLAYQVVADPWDRDFVMRTIYKHLRGLIILYCACQNAKAARDILNLNNVIEPPGDWNPLEFYFQQGLEKIPNFPTEVGTATHNLSWILMNYLDRIYEASNPEGDHDICKDPNSLPNLLSDLEAEDLSLEDDQGDIDTIWGDVGALARAGLSANPTTSITPCAEPKVAIIEDYLVEQGLAIGVAGILGATALGLYLRGNRAAAVTLIATATAAVGGTATGAESVMNAVDTDYNRSVRFGGQQDCRNSNQTGAVEEGD